MNNPKGEDNLGNGLKSNKYKCINVNIYIDMQPFDG